MVAEDHQVLEVVRGPPIHIVVAAVELVVIDQVQLVLLSRSDLTLHIIRTFMGTQDIMHRQLMQLESDKSLE